MNADTPTHTFVSIPRTRWTYAAIPVQLGTTEISQSTYNFDGSAFEEWVSRKTLKTAETLEQIVQGSVCHHSIILHFLTHFFCADHRVQHQEVYWCPRKLRHRRNHHPRRLQDRGVQDRRRNHHESRSPKPPSSFRASIRLHPRLELPGARDPYLACDPEETR